jgi:hypothetical protein
MAVPAVIEQGDDWVILQWDQIDTTDPQPSYELIWQIGGQNYETLTRTTKTKFKVENLV